MVVKSWFPIRGIKSQWERYTHVTPKRMTDELIKTRPKLPQRESYREIRGWFAPTDVTLYKKAVREAPKEGAHFVEIGAYQGRSTFAMCQHLRKAKKNITFDTIDHFKGSDNHQRGQGSQKKEVILGQLYDIFIDNIEPMKDLVNIKRMSSEEACPLYKDNSLDFVYIDAQHDTESVYEDLTRWYEKVKDGGILGGHDYTWPSVRVALTMFMRDKKIFPDECNPRGRYSWWFRIKKG